jgi:hypothetical protein
MNGSLGIIVVNRQIPTVAVITLTFFLESILYY